MLLLDTPPGRAVLHLLLMEPSLLSIALCTYAPIPLFGVVGFLSGSIRPWLGLIAGGRMLVLSGESLFVELGSKRIELLVGKRFCLDLWGSPELFIEGEDLWDLTKFGAGVFRGSWEGPGTCVLLTGRSSVSFSGTFLAAAMATLSSVDFDRILVDRLRSKDCFDNGESLVPMFRDTEERLNSFSDSSLGVSIFVIWVEVSGGGMSTPRGSGRRCQGESGRR